MKMTSSGNDGEWGGDAREARRLAGMNLRSSIIQNKTKELMKCEMKGRNLRKHEKKKE